MNQITEPQKQKLFWIAFPTLCLISISLITLTIIPNSREFVRSQIIQNSRKILAKADGDITGHGFNVSVIKVQTADTLSLEIFKLNIETNESKFLKRIILNEKRDAYFQYRGNAANLVISDIDRDGNLEILSPTFDDNLIPRLNVFKFDQDRNDFIKLGPESSSI